MARATTVPERLLVLQLSGVRKSYTTGDFTQVALDDLSIAFRDNEFVAVLGPSGSGKTTMLNIVGGLDHYDSGDLVIDGTSTKKYKDRDWDTYRNNRVGFVFQSYNLIPHQSVLANVELALTLAGASPGERRRRAEQALDEVGLAEHVHKRPSQLSGGQMQRVAIARALVNDPEILLADEPTGALDSTTSVQIMDLLTAIARDRLVVMVTHNPDLAERYATRTISLRDGLVVTDTDPYTPEDQGEAEPERSKRTTMSFLTAIALSFNNLMTKKGRTLMTSFAGSIGIIGIAAILALANGVNSYIKDVEEETLSMYPLTIQSQGLDMTSLLASSAGVGDGSDEQTTTEGEVREYQLLGRMLSSVGTNDLASLKEFLDGGGSGIDEHINAIEYSYDVTPQIYLPATDAGVQRVNPDGTFSAMGFSADPEASSSLAGMGSDVFAQLGSDLSLVEPQYDVVAGRWPQERHETIVVLSDSGGMSDYMLYAMGLRDRTQLDAMVTQMADGQEVDVPEELITVTHEEILDVTFSLVHATDYYSFDADFGVWTDTRSDAARLRGLVDGGEELEVVGILQSKPDATATALQPGIYYTPDLTRHIIETADASDVVAAQLADPATDVFSGSNFSDDTPATADLDLSELITIDEEAIAAAFTFDESALELDLSNLDLSGLQMPDMQLDPSLLPPLDLDAVVAGLDLSQIITLPDVPADDTGTDETGTDELTDEVSTLATQVADAFTAFVQASDLDPLDVAGNMELFLGSEEAAALLAPPADGGPVSAPTAMVEDYLDWAVASGVDPADVATNLPTYLAQNPPVAVPADNSLVGGIIADYLTFTTGAGLDPIDVEGNFPLFLAGAEGQAIQADVLDLVDLTSVEQQLQSVLGDYMQEVMAVYMGTVGEQISSALQTQVSAAMESAMGQLAENMSSAMGIDEEAFAEALSFDMDPEELTQVLMSMAGGERSSYGGNLRRLGWADFADPARIDIYPQDFVGKGAVTDILEEYNAGHEAAGDEDKVITWTDIVGTLMSSVTDIINMVSYVLIAFVAISLVVSSIMIGVITYISVLERKKEIGILRSIGASKGDVARVFNAETLIVGFVAGALGIGITALLTLPANAIVESRFDVADVAVLPWQAAIVLVLISMLLTFLAGLIPSSAASRKDPVEALRSE